MTVGEPGESPCWALSCEVEITGVKKSVTE